MLKQKQPKDNDKYTKHMTEKIKTEQPELHRKLFSAVFELVRYSSNSVYLRNTLHGRVIMMVFLLLNGLFSIIHLNLAYLIRKY